MNPSWSRVIFLDGYRFGLPFYFEVGVFDFDASLTNKTEVELARMDVHAQSRLTTAAAAAAAVASSSKSKHRGKFPHRVMGTALFEVGQILGSRGNIASKSLQSGGVLTVHMERCQNANSGRLHLHLHGYKIKPPHTTARSANSFYELFRKVDRPTGAVWEKVYRSNVVKNSLSPLWTDVYLDLEATCNGDLDRAIKIMVLDYKRSGKHKFMGECETTVRVLAAAGEDHHNNNTSNGNEENEGYHRSYRRRNNKNNKNNSKVLSEESGFELIRESKMVGRLQVQSACLLGNEGGPESSPETEGNGPCHPEYLVTPPGSTNGGIVKPNSAENTNTRPEFVDYLSGGCQISLAVAIDFTASNGDPREPGTPHYFHSPQSKEWNDYEKAIFAVGSILAKYDSDQRMPVWGFGAKYNGVVRHCFQCGHEVEVEGVQGIMDAYRGVFRTPLTMSYPTKLNEVVETAASYARHEQVRCMGPISRKIQDMSFGEAYLTLWIALFGTILFL